MIKNTLRVSLALVAVGAIAFAPTAPAFAAVTSKAENTQNVSSGAVLVFATSAQTFVNPRARLSTSVSNSGSTTFYVNNGGTLGVNAFALIIVLPANSNVSSFKRCALNVAFTGTGTCATGTPVSVTITPGSATSYVLSLPASSFYSFQVVQNKSGTMTVDSYANITHYSGSVTNS